MSLLEKLRIEKGDIPIIGKKSSNNEIIVEKSVSAIGSSGSSTLAFTVKCKGCREIIMLTPALSDFTCRCGIHYTLPTE